MQASIFKSSRSPFWYINLKREGEPAERFSLKVKDKQVAEQLKANHVKESGQERAGMLPAKPLREASLRPLLDHLEDFIAARAGAGKDPDYLRITRQRMKKLFAECGWKYLREITADKFSAWRSRQDLTAKTLNHYLVTMNTLLHWLERGGKLLTNPLKTVERTTKEGGKKRLRRGYSEDEICRLLSKAPSDTYRLLIRFAVLTGLRRDEIALLQWDDLHLDGTRPHITLRSSTVKNRKGKPHNLHPALIEDLAALKPAGAKPTQAVFPEMPDMAEHRALLDAAGVLYTDAAGRYADFHSFRKTHGTNLYRAGVLQRTATELMRLSSPKLLDDVYTDVLLLPSAEDLAKLNGFGEYAKKYDKDLVQTSSDQSIPVPQMDLSGATQPFQHEGSSPLESNSVPISQETEKGSGGRART